MVFFARTLARLSWSRPIRANKGPLRCHCRLGASLGCHLYQARCFNRNTSGVDYGVFVMGWLYLCLLCKFSPPVWCYGCMALADPMFFSKNNTVIKVDFLQPQWFFFRLVVKCLEAFLMLLLKFHVHYLVSILVVFIWSFVTNKRLVRSLG